MDTQRYSLQENVPGVVDAEVRDQIVAESQGNPLALLELSRSWDAVGVAGGFGVPEGVPPADKIERSYLRRLEQLPPDTSDLVLAAAAEPLGDPHLLRRAVETLGIDLAAGDAAVNAGLLTVGARIEFANTLLRSVAYWSASVERRRAVHGALADATDRTTDPDRRAWHLARSTSGPDVRLVVESHAIERLDASGPSARGDVLRAPAGRGVEGLGEDVGGTIVEDGCARACNRGRTATPVCASRATRGSGRGGQTTKRG